MKYIFSVNRSPMLLFILCICLSQNSYAQTYSGKEKDINQILVNIETFSSFYMNAQYQELAECYTEDGKIFPGNTRIIEGIDAIRERWTLPEGMKTLHHKIFPEEITIVKKTAYDYGYYEGTNQRANGEKVNFKGKYVIVWKKVGKDWKIYLDIWNRVAE
ncbi:MAG: nuclear transport factor 2 family protein [Bacteroidota bacterium]